MSQTSRRALLVSTAAALAGCPDPSGLTGGQTTTPTANDGRTPDSGGAADDEAANSDRPIASGESRVGYPHLRASGNRVAAGRGALPEVDPVDVALPGVPTWLAAVPTSGGSAWAVVTRPGRLSTVSLRDGNATVTELGEWPVERPPVLRKPRTDPRVVRPPDDGTKLAPPLVMRPTADTAGTAATPLDDEPPLATVTADGDLLVSQGGGGERVPADLLVDARVCRLDDRRAVALGGPTDRYAHGALGDETEASEIVVLDLSEPGVERRIAVSSDRVVEGVAPIVADLGGDRAIVVTESGASAGARLVAYAPDGSVLASGEPVGAGFRWRHQIAVAPFAPDGPRELAVVRTPHIGGTVEFYRRRGENLDVVATVSGASSHAYRSRNLDGGLAADADGDGRVELVVPDDDRRTLRGIERDGDGAAVEWSVPVGGGLTTNLVGVGHGDGLAVGVGSAADGGQLRVWPP